MKKLFKKKDFIVLLILIIILISLLPFYIFKIEILYIGIILPNYSYETYNNYMSPVFSIEKICIL